MLDWLKRKYNNAVAKHVTHGDYRKPHFRMLTTEDKQDIESACKRQPGYVQIKWYRTAGSRNSFYIFPESTIEMVKKATGKTINYLGGEWYEVTYED